MFTGIVEEVGLVRAAASGELTIGAGVVMSGLALGQSSAVHGVSRTVIARDATSFAVSIVAYTRAHTTIAERRVGDLVNVETDVMAQYVAAAVVRLAGRGNRP